MSADARPREVREALVLALLLLALIPRLLYTAAQPGCDPSFAQPRLDAAYYLDWARQLADGRPGPPGAYYLAPLYPHVVALLFKLLGPDLERLLWAQQLLSLATAWIIARGCRGLIGGEAALVAGMLFLLHHPLLFFSARPLGESLALFFLFASIALIHRRADLAIASAGALVGVGALARPNLLLVPLVWCAGETILGHYRRALLIAGGVLLAVAPVATRNLVVSGHAAPISTNSGITAYHGNAPGARGGYTRATGFSGDVAKQRDEATLLARRAAGRDLDAVEADRWWGVQALRARLADPAGSIALLLRRGLMLVDNHEYGLAAHPSLDANPWRATWRRPVGNELAWVPFAALLGLAASALVLAGVRGSGGWTTWGALFACALTPLLFYVSSRYRLPAAALLVLPAGVGAIGLSGRRGIDGAARLRAGVIGSLVLAASLAISAADLFGLGAMRRTGFAEALANRSAAFKATGDLASAERDARRAVELAPESAASRYNLGVIVEAGGRTRAAEQLYRDALSLSGGGMAEAAANLSRILIDRGAAAEAIPLLAEAIEKRPIEPTCWNNLVVALMMTGRRDEARDALERAGALGIRLDPELVGIVRSGSPQRSPDEPGSR